MLDALFRPRGVAVIGASNNPLSIGHIVMKNLIAHGFRGPIYPINPKDPSILDRQAYRSILEVPGEVDLVNISIKNTLVAMAIEECGRKGVKFAIVHTAGFKEVGEEGAALERQVVEIAHGHGMRVYGPNSQGVQNSDPEVSLYANFTFVPMSPGNVSILAQSGGVGEVLKLHLYKIGMGIRMYTSYGNECDVSMNEILAHYGDDPGTRVIMLHIETLKDPAGFIDLVSRISRHKPVLALKSGRTREGLVAVSSHTGTLMEADTTTEVIFRKAGVLRFLTQQEMIDAAIAFSSQPPARGRRLAVVTNTGGPGILAVDECMEAGLTLARLSEETKTFLRGRLHAEATVKNPVDVIATASPEHYYLTVETLLKDPNVDAVLVNFISAPFVDMQGVSTRIAEAARGADKPVVCCVMTIPEWGELINTIRRGGVPVFEFPERAARVMVAMARYGEVQARAEAEDRAIQPLAKVAAALGSIPASAAAGREAPDAGAVQPPAASASLFAPQGKPQGAVAEIPPATGRDEVLPVVDRAGAEQIIAAAAASGGGFISQAEAYQLLDCYGIPAPRRVSASGKDELAGAAEGLAFPVVLKIDEPAVVHKTEAGGVVLGIKDAKKLLKEYKALGKRLGRKSPRVLVQEMAEAGREVIVGAQANTGIPPTMMFGLGGIFVEVMKDVQFRLAPLTREEAEEMIRAIRGLPILAGTRGQAGVDLPALADVLVSASRLAADHPGIREMDLNPVFSYPAGRTPLVADVRIRVGKC